MLARWTFLGTLTLRITAFTITPLDPQHNDMAIKNTLVTIMSLTIMAECHCA
jgi:hypothetical protein